MLMLIAVTSAAANAADQPVTITTVAGFVPGDDAKVTTPITVHLPSAAAVGVRIVAPGGVAVRTLTSGASLPAGDSVLRWDGRADDGAQVPAGSYVVSLVVLPSDPGSAGAGGSAQAAIAVDRPVVEITDLKLMRGVLGASPASSALSAQLSMSRRGFLSAVIADGFGRVMANLQVGAITAGPHPLVWRGVTDAGAAVPDGTYHLLVAASAGGLPSRTVSLPLGVDRTAPTISLTNLQLAPHVTRRARTITLRLTSSEAGRVEVVNGRHVARAVVAAGSHGVVVDLAALRLTRRQQAHGAHLRVQVIDLAGNPSPVRSVTIRRMAVRSIGLLLPTRPLPPVVPTASASSAQAADIAMRYLGVPYVWAGSTPLGFDCSGLVMYAFSNVGVLLPHSTYIDWTLGTHVSMDQLQKGDLVFFNGREHMGIYLGNGQFVHAPHTGDVVKVSSLTGWYARTFDGGVRLS